MNPPALNCKHCLGTGTDLHDELPCRCTGAEKPAPTEVRLWPWWVIADRVPTIAELSTAETNEYMIVNALRAPQDWSPMMVMNRDHQRGYVAGLLKGSGLPPSYRMTVVLVHHSEDAEAAGIAMVNAWNKNKKDPP